MVLGAFATVASAEAAADEYKHYATGFDSHFMQAYHKVNLDVDVTVKDAGGASGDDVDADADAWIILHCVSAMGQSMVKVEGAVTSLEAAEHFLASKVHRDSDSGCYRVLRRRVGKLCNEPLPVRMEGVPHWRLCRDCGRFPPQAFMVDYVRRHFDAGTCSHVPTDLMPVDSEAVERREARRRRARIEDDADEWDVDPDPRIPQVLAARAAHKADMDVRSLPVEVEASLDDDRHIVDRFMATFGAEHAEVLKTQYVIEQTQPLTAQSFRCHWCCPDGFRVDCVQFAKLLRAIGRAEEADALLKLLL